jgi:hypothetical protein
MGWVRELVRLYKALVVPLHYVIIMDYPFYTGLMVFGSQQFPSRRPSYGLWCMGL